jgi:uncharacterized protein (DUF58 family)
MSYIATILLTGAIFLLAVSAETLVDAACLMVVMGISLALLFCSCVINHQSAKA